MYRKIVSWTSHRSCDPPEHRRQRLHFQVYWSCFWFVCRAGVLFTWTMFHWTRCIRYIFSIMRQSIVFLKHYEHDGVGGSCCCFANRRVLNIKDFAFTMYRGVRNKLNEDNGSTVSNYVCAEYFFREEWAWASGGILIKSGWLYKKE